jgi:hypothetical protein
MRGSRCTHLNMSSAVATDFYNTVMPGVEARIAEIGNSVLLLDHGDVLRIGPEGGAIFDATEQYRYLLWRVWDSTLPAVMFIGLNPSTANHEKSDPTCTRERGFATRWGAGSYVKGNLYAYRATKPKDMKAQEDPAGPNNLDYLLQACRLPFVKRVIAAWGTHAREADEANFWDHWDSQGEPFDVIDCMGLTKSMKPKHPLYLPAHTEPRPFWCKSVHVALISTDPAGVAQPDTDRLQSIQRSESAASPT